MKEEFITLFVLNVARKPQFHLDLLGTSLFIAASVSGRYASKFKIAPWVKLNSLSAPRAAIPNVRVLIRS